MAGPARFPVLRETDLAIKDGPLTGADLRDVLKRMFGQLNASLDATNKITAKGVTLSENMRCDVITGSFAHGVAQQVALKTLTRAGSASVLGCDGQLVAHSSVTMVQGTSKTPLASVTIWFNDSTASKVTCTVQLLPEGSQTATTPTFLEAASKASYCTAEYTTAAGQSIPNIATTIVNFGTPVKDTASAVTVGAAWKFTVPTGKAGEYLICACVSWATAPGTDVQLVVHKNGTATIQLAEPIHSAAYGVAMSITGSGVLTAVAGDTIDVRVFQNSGGAVLLKATALTNRVTVTRILGS